MKIHALLLLVMAGLLAQCGKTPVSENATPQPPAPAPAGMVPVVTTGDSPHFMKVSSHLELGGASFNYAEQESMVDLLGGFMDEVLGSLPEAERKDLPATFSFKKVFSILGLDAVKAAGASSRRMPTGLYHSRSFAYTPQGRNGLLSLTGSVAAPFITHQVAPKDTDLALEFPLHLKQFATEAVANILSMVPAEQRPEIEAQLAQKVPPLGLSLREMAEKLDARVAIIARLIPGQQLGVPTPGVDLPGIDALIVIDRLGWLLEGVKKQFLPMLSDPSAPVEMSDKDGILTLTFRAPMGPVPMDYQPMLRFDTKADRLIIATRPGIMQAALGTGTGLLAAQADFQQAWQGMPLEGNSSLFASKRLLQTFATTLRQSVKKDKSLKEGAAVADKMLALLATHLNQSQALCTANQPDGILAVANTSFSAGNPSSLASVTTVAVLASLAVPAYQKIQVKATSVKDINHAKQVCIALKIYAGEHDGKYPEKLDELARSGLITAELLTIEDPATHERLAWLHNPTLTDAAHGNAVLLAAPFTIKDGGVEKRTVVRNDGSAELLEEGEFQQAKDDNLR